MKRYICVLLAMLCLLALAGGFAQENTAGEGENLPSFVFVREGEPSGDPETEESDTLQEQIIPIIGPVESAQAVHVAQAASTQPPSELLEDALATEAAEPTAELRLAGIIIGLDPGHQAHANSELEQVAPGSKERKAKVSSGTQGVSTGVAEYIVDLDISLKLRDALEKEGCIVYMTRETNDVDISNMERALMMNDNGAQLVLRLHCDGSTDRSANGIGMFIRKTGTGREESELAAGLLLDAMTECTGAKARGIFKRDTYTGLNWSEVPCILVEMGYMSNPVEDEKLNDPAYQDLLVEGMVEGICAYFGR